MRLGEWGYESTGWRHWAVPCRDDAPELDCAVPFDPGRRAALAGDPDALSQASSVGLDVDEATRVVTELLRGWHPELHRAAGLGLVSEVGEGREEFRRRCLRTLGGAVRSGAGRGGVGVEALDTVWSSIESRVVGSNELELLGARVGIGWYGEGDEPRAEGGELMVTGTPRAGR